MYGSVGIHGCGQGVVHQIGRSVGDRKLLTVEISTLQNVTQSLDT